MFQSTRPVRGATTPCKRLRCSRRVSIHAPRTGRDWCRSSATCPPPRFNPRAPYGARPCRLSQLTLGWGFQSTRPVRGATQEAITTHRTNKFQSTRPVRGATSPTGTARTSTPSFNPRAPYGARLQQVGPLARRLAVSIHAPRTGRDWRSRPASRPVQSFNPRAPYGARLATSRRVDGSPLFQSTRPVRGATPLRRGRGRRIPCFNPRAPYGARRPPRRSAARRPSFNPRAPYGARPGSWLVPPSTSTFQSTRPVRGATVNSCIAMN